MVTVNGNRAEFIFYRPKARSVYLTGDFNGCAIGDLSMTCDRGYWRWDSPAGRRLQVPLRRGWPAFRRLCGIRHKGYSVDSSRHNL